jgi:hypothetical protein
MSRVRKLEKGGRRGEEKIRKVERKLRRVKTEASDDRDRDRKGVKSTSAGFSIESIYI